MMRESEKNGEDMRALFKMLQNEGRVHVSDVDKLSKKIDRITEEGADSRPGSYQNTRQRTKVSRKKKNNPKCPR